MSARGIIPPDENYPDENYPDENATDRSAPEPGIRAALQAHRLRAMKQRDTVALSACRTALAALDNAQAVPADPERHRAGAIEASVVGIGAAEVPRRELSRRDEEAIVRAEVAERHTVAGQLDASRPQAAARLRAEAAVLERILGGEVDGR